MICARESAMLSKPKMSCKQIAIQEIFFVSSDKQRIPDNPETQASVGKKEPPPPYACQQKKGELIIKRIIDIVGSLVGLILFSPFFLISAILIKIESPGPVFFRQVRIGKDGREFTFLKFRTMRAINAKEEESYIKNVISRKSEVDHKSIIFKMSDNPRITRVGWLLRRTTLDEIPQFINVLKGDMSLVGPRPPLPYEVEIYEEWHKERLKCKPGITGMWQLHGGSVTSFDEMIKMDIKYMKEWSLWLDLKIILKTMLTGRLV